MSPGGVQGRVGGVKEGVGGGEMGRGCGRLPQIRIQCSHHKTIKGT